MRYFEFDTLTEILLTMKQNKLRTFLTGFAVSWGIFMLIVLLGSGNGLKNGIMSNFGDRATNSMMLWGGRTTMPYKGFKAYRRLTLTNHEVTMLKNTFKEIDLITGEVYRSSLVSNKQESGNYSISGVQPDYYGINKLKIRSGRFINDMDIRQERKVIVLPRKVAQLLFKDEDPLGKWVKVDGLSFQVVGIDHTSERGDGGSCYIPLPTAQKVYHMGIETQRISFTVNGLYTEEDNEAFGKRIREFMGRRLIVHPDDLNSIGLWNQAADYVQTMNIFATIDLFVLFIGICTLVAGLVGVGNIMVITVKERTREFGIRKSLGATPATILSSILLESVVVTTLFGYGGMLLGIGILEGLNIVLSGNGGGDGGSGMRIFLNPTVDLNVVLGATLLLITAGLVAGYFPARKAVRIKPIEAMRAD